MDIREKQTRYIKICTWLRKRYSQNGLIVTHVGNSPSKYTRLELAFYNRIFNL